MNRAIETYEEAKLQIHVSTYKPVSGSIILQKWSIYFKLSRYRPEQAHGDPVG